MEIMTRLLEACVISQHFMSLELDLVRGAVTLTILDNLAWCFPTLDMSQTW